MLHSCVLFLICVCVCVCKEETFHEGKKQKCEKKMGVLSLSFFVKWRERVAKQGVVSKLGKKSYGCFAAMDIFFPLLCY